MGAEWRVRIEYPDHGQTQFYELAADEGNGAAPRLVRTEWRDGQTSFYAGERGAERMVRTEWPDGQKEYYKGEMNAERLIRVHRAVKPRRKRGECCIQ